jgi:hypothetical protein
MRSPHIEHIFDERTHIACFGLHEVYIEHPAAFSIYMLYGERTPEQAYVRAALGALGCTIRVYRGGCTHI